MADGKIQLEIVTPERRMLSQPVDEVRVPGTNGGFGVLPGHTPLVSGMRAGQLDAVAGGQKLTFAVGEGFVQVAHDRVLVLAEVAMRAEEIDLAAAQAAVERETRRLRGMVESDPEYELARARVEREVARVMVANRR
jgi:F-type H+-transporting ATPase subunit epsilon